MSVYMEVYMYLVDVLKIQVLRIYPIYDGAVLY